MGENTKIEWCHHTFNPWWGCWKVSEACANCYAETWAKRTGNSVWGKDAPRRFFGDKHWNKPLKWNRQAKADGVRRRVFCASMADVFEDREDLVDQRRRLFRVIASTPDLDWLLLTKRPQNVIPLTPTFDDYLPKNIWLGTTAENQERWDERVPVLASIPASVRFVSAEPLLGPIKMGKHRPNWLIVGGESGPGARPMHKEWVESLRGQCDDRTAFFFKQWGGVRKNETGRELNGRTWDAVPV